MIYYEKSLFFYKQLYGEEDITSLELKMLIIDLYPYEKSPNIDNYKNSIKLSLKKGIFTSIMKAESLKVISKFDFIQKKEQNLDNFENEIKGLEDALSIMKLHLSSLNHLIIADIYLCLAKINQLNKNHKKHIIEEYYERSIMTLKNCFGYPHLKAVEVYYSLSDFQVKNLIVKKRMQILTDLEHHFSNEEINILRNKTINDNNFVCKAIDEYEIRKDISILLERIQSHMQNRSNIESSIIINDDSSISKIKVVFIILKNASNICQETLNESHHFHSDIFKLSEKINYLYKYIN